MGDLFESVESDLTCGVEEEVERARGEDGSVWSEGRDFGVGKGWELGMEVGFYVASMKTWQKLNPAVASTQRFQRQFKKLSKYVELIEGMDAGDERFDTVLTQLRNAYELACRALHVEQKFRCEEEEAGTDGHDEIF
eukprot:m.240570 g.240570  ORF g.240570 m.240570 type:complete len:137 (+) comp15422_c1_seq1:71-481(+)